MENEALLKETYRYLGYRGSTPDEESDALIRQCLQDVQEAARPASAMRRVEVTWREQENTLDLGPICVQSKTLARHLRGCHHAVIFAATIGIEVDRMIKRARIGGIAREAMLQAAGAAVVEEYCDRIEAQVIAEEKERGYITRTRYSPGYGDFALEHQPEVLSLLNASKQAGITLTDGFLMIPSKSVTAVIGIADS